MTFVMVFAGKLVYNSSKGGMLMQSIALTAAARAALGRYGLDARTLTGCRVQQYQPGETVLRQGDDAAYFHIVLDGAAKVCVNARNGRHLILCYYASSGVLGDVELMLPSPKTTNTVIAVSAFSCAAVPLRENRDALLGNLAFISRIGQELAQKLLRSSDAHMISALYTSRERLCAYILTTQQSGVFREYLTDAVQSVGVSYRQAQRIMQSLCALGVLQKVDSGFQILDMPQLQALSCQGEATA